MSPSAARPSGRPGTSTASHGGRDPNARRYSRPERIESGLEWVGWHATRPADFRRQDDGHPWPFYWAIIYEGRAPCAIVSWSELAPSPRSSSTCVKAPPNEWPTMIGGFGNARMICS